MPGWDGTIADYRVLAEHLRAHGYAVYGSEQATGVHDPVAKRRGHPRHWPEWVRDLQDFTSFVAQRHPRLPLFYHGHSFGTLVAAQTTAAAKVAHRPAGLILQSVAMPFLIERESALADVFMGAASWMRVPHLALIEATGRGPTGDATLNCQWLRSEDRLRIGYKVGYFHEAAKLGHQVWQTSQKLTLPVLALEGERDNVVAPKPADKARYHRFLSERLRGGQADVLPYPDGYHTMTITPTGNPALNRTTEKVLRDITHWLDRQTAAARR